MQPVFGTSEKFEQALFGKIGTYLTEAALRYEVIEEKPKPKPKKKKSKAKKGKKKKVEMRDGIVIHFN